MGEDESKYVATYKKVYTYTTPQLQKKHNVIALTVYLRFKYTLIKTWKVVSVAVKVVIYVQNS